MTLLPENVRPDLMTKEGGRQADRTEGMHSIQEKKTISEYSVFRILVHTLLVIFCPLYLSSVSLRSSGSLDFIRLSLAVICYIPSLPCFIHSSFL
jgi:hypothetical protein